MKLTKDQITQLKSWLEVGLSLSKIQDCLQKEWNLSLTYMDLRFLIDDLGLHIIEKTSKKDSEISPAMQLTPESPLSHPATSVTVTVDAVTRPGAVVSGQVTFSDGIKGNWHLDQMGRIALSPSEHGYKPSPEDIKEFQKTLQDELHRAGF